MKKLSRFLIILILPIQLINYSFKNSENNKNRTDKLNILFIAADDLRLQAGVNGQSHMITPNLDKLKSEGIAFTRSYCSISVCGSSRASLLFGLHPTPNRLLDYYTIKDIDAPKVSSLPIKR